MVGLLELIVKTYLWRGSHVQTTIFRRWLQQLPPDVIRSRPYLSLAYAASLNSTALPSEIEPWLQAAETELARAPRSRNLYTPERDDLSENEREHLLGNIFTLRAFATSYYGDGQVILAWCQLALAHLSEQDYKERRQ